jgi:hypothetical protein
MNNYLDLTAIETRIFIQLILEPVGIPEYMVQIKNRHWTGQLSTPGKFLSTVSLYDKFEVKIELKNKIKTESNQETALKIKLLQIDHIDMIPRFTHLANYTNDHAFTAPTDYLGFNGSWVLHIDRPFYHWLHEHTGQGWLLG